MVRSCILDERRYGRIILKRKCRGKHLLTQTRQRFNLIISALYSSVYIHTETFSTSEFTVLNVSYKIILRPDISVLLSISDTFVFPNTHTQLTIRGKKD